MCISICVMDWRGTKKEEHYPTYNGGELEAREGLLHGHLELGVLVGVGSEPNSNTVLDEGVLGVDHTREAVSTLGETHLLDLGVVECGEKIV